MKVFVCVIVGYDWFEIKNVFTNEQRAKSFCDRYNKENHHHSKYDDGADYFTRDLQEGEELEK